MHLFTVRIDEADHAELVKRADQLKVRPGTLARMLVHAGLNEDGLTNGGDTPAAAIERLVRRSRRGPRVDAVSLVSEARSALGADR